MAHDSQSAEYWITALKLQRHPEGGHFAETYRSAVRVDGTTASPAFHGERCLATAIYYLLRSGERSALHRLSSDEMWHFYAGQGLTLYLIAPDGSGRETRLGCRADRGEVLQALIPAGTWFGARVTASGAYALCGCTVSPGFEYEDFEMGRREALLRGFPQHREWIMALTSDPA